MFSLPNWLSQPSVSVASFVEGVSILGDRPDRVNRNFHFGQLVFETLF
jgi:hypothetical protein